MLAEPASSVITVSDTELPSHRAVLQPVSILPVSYPLVVKYLSVPVDVPEHRIPLPVRRHVVLVPHLHHPLLREKRAHPVVQAAPVQVISPCGIKDIRSDIERLRFPYLVLNRCGQLHAPYSVVGLLVVLRSAVCDKPFRKGQALPTLLVNEHHALINLAFQLIRPERMNIPVDVVSAAPHFPVPDKLKAHNLRNAVKYPVPINQLSHNMRILKRQVFLVAQPLYAVLLEY